MLLLKKYIPFAVAILSISIYACKKLRAARKIEKRVLSDLIGNTPLIYLQALSRRTGKEIFAKCEFMNPCGSMKDRVALALLRARSSDHVYEGTSGSTGVSLTLIGNSIGCKTSLYLPDDLEESKYRILETLGAQIVKVRPVSIVDSNHYCKRAEREAAAAKGYFADQFNNLSNYETHLKTAEEIYRQTKGQVDCFVMSAGTGGGIAGASRWLKKKKPSVKVVLADPPGSSLKNHVLYGVCYTHQEKEGTRVKHPLDTVVEGVGQNRLTKNFEQAIIDYAYTISDEESREMGEFLIKNEGLFVGGSSALNCCAVVKAVEQYPECKVFVTILCDSGQRYLSKFYNPNYHI